MPKQQFQLEIDLGNEAFDSPSKRIDEVARLLREAAIAVEAGKGNAVVYDVNGNRIGSWYLDEIEEPEDETRACSACGDRTPTNDPECHLCGETE